MKIKTFVSAAAAMAVLLTGCASKNSSSSEESTSQNSDNNTTAASQNEITDETTSQNSENNATAASQNDVTDETNKSQAEIKTLNYDAPEYSTDNFHDYNNRAFSFKMNYDFHLITSDQFDYENNDTPLHLTFRHELAQKIDITLHNDRVEPEVYLMSFYDMYVDMYDCDDIYFEHSEHDGIYTGIISGTFGNTAYSIAIAAKDGNILNISVPFYNKDALTKVVPMLKDVIESTKYISDTNVSEGIKEIDNDVFSIPIDQKYNCKDGGIVLMDYFIHSSFKINITDSYNIKYSWSENNEQWHSLFSINTIDKTDFSSVSELSNNIISGLKEYNEYIDNVYSDIKQCKSEFKGIPAETISFYIPNHKTVVKSTLFEHNGKIVILMSSYLENSKSSEEDFNNLIDSIKLK